MTWETVIGLETHVELATRTKIFCSCTTAFGGAPNTHCCPVCTGMPGTLPVMNKAVMRYAAKAGLALNCDITRYHKFDRKNYFYPDLPKAYQISQLYLPIATNGKVPIQLPGGEEKIIRIHSSSGTTGTPVVIPYTQKDVDDWATMFARCYETAGITNTDRIHITPGYGLWTAGIGFQLGCERLGAMAIPMGPGNTEKQLQMMQDLRSTVITGTSSYALLLAEEIEKRGLRDKLYLRKGVIGSERWGDKGMAQVHYVLKSVKALRNACSHNSCIINGFSSSAVQASFPTSDPIGESLTRHGMKRSKARRSKMSNLRVAQIAAALYASSVFCTRPSTMERHGGEMQRAREALSATLPLCPADGSLSAYFEFLFKLIDIWTPYRP